MARSWNAYFKVIFSVVAWGASFIATKVALQEIHPATVVWLRFGNCTKRELFAWLEPLLPAIIRQLEQGDRLIEVR